jgi:orotate phosphoribosyltransferase
MHVMRHQQWQDELRQWVHGYIDEHCIVRRPGGLPGKKPGTVYSWMFYLRRGLFNHRFNSAVAQLFWYKVDERIGHGNFQLTGLETAAAPMLAAFPIIGNLYDYDVNAFIVRKERKEYGLQNMIEGLPNNKPAMIIDDLCNSSTSMARCYKHLLFEKIEVFPFAFALVNKVNPGTHDPIREKSDMYLPKSIEVLSLFNISEFRLYNPSH